MKKSILEINGARLLDKKAQLSITGGHDRTICCGRDLTGACVCRKNNRGGPCLTESGSFCPWPEF